MSDTCLRFRQFAQSDAFVSCCESLVAAQQLLLRPPNPFADKIVELLVAGPIVRMVYDDGTPGERKRTEEEVLVLLKCVVSANIM